MTLAKEQDKWFWLRMWVGIIGFVLFLCGMIGIIIHLSITTIYSDGGSTIGILDQEHWSNRTVRVIPDRSGCIVIVSSSEDQATPLQMHWVDETHIHYAARLDRPIMAVDTRVAPVTSRSYDTWHRLALLMPSGSGPTEHRFVGPPTPVETRLITEFWREEKESEKIPAVLVCVGLITVMILLWPKSK